MIDRDLFYWLAPLIFFVTKAAKGIYRKTKNFQFLFILLLLGAFLVCFFWFVFDSYKETFHSLLPTDKNSDVNRGNWGAFGDYFGGLLNPAVAFVGILLLAYGLYQTNKEIRSAKESFDLNIQLMNIQNFDNRFFQMLTMLNNKRESLYWDNAVQGREFHGSELFHEIRPYVPMIHNDLDNALLSYYFKFKQHLNSYFQTLETLLIHLRNELIKEKNKEGMYIRILFGSMTTDEAHVVKCYVAFLSNFINNFDQETLYHLVSDNVSDEEFRSITSVANFEQHILTEMAQMSLNFKEMCSILNDHNIIDNW